MASIPPACDRLVAEAEILGLEPDEADPVRIILAAQLRLRRCRQVEVAGSRCSATDVRRIITARDALLSRAVGSLARLSTISLMGRGALASAGAAAEAGVRELSHR